MKDSQSNYRSTPSFSTGRKIREEVMGADYVQRSLKAAEEDGTSDLQQIATEFAWGTVWNRQGLDRKQRSLATVAMLVVLNRPRELAGHLRGALANGVTPEELRELMIHSAVYGGFPAALDSMRTLAEFVKES